MVTIPQPTVGPCQPWITIADVRAFCADLDADDTLIETNAGVASEVLFDKSGRQFTGTCTETLRPACISQLAMYPADWWRAYGYFWDDPWGWGNGGAGGWPFLPVLVSGQWLNIGMNMNTCVAWDCGQRIDVFDLGVYPITSASVRVDGVALDPSVYTVRDHRYIVRTDGNGWPTAQDLMQPDTATGTWSVTVGHGFAPPAAGKLAAQELACQLTKFTVGDQCNLPLQVTQVSRAGVFYRMADVTRLLDAGRTGLYWTDSFLASVNPDNLRRAPRVRSLDRRPVVSRLSRS